MKKFAFFLLILIVGSVLPAQHITRKAYQLSRPVSELEVKGAIRVVYSDQVEKVTIAAPAEAFQYIHVEVLRNEPTLRVRYDRRKATKNSAPTLYVPMSFHIEDFDFSGACSFSSTQPITGQEVEFSIDGACTVKCAFDMPTGKLEIDLSGAGSFSASGQVNELDLDISGAGEFSSEFTNHAYQFQTNRAECDVSGAGDVSLHCVSLLEADLAGACCLSYSGNPTTHIEKAGACSITHKK